MFVSSPISLVKESSLLVKCQFWMVYTKHLQEIPSHGKKRWFPVDFPTTNPLILRGKTSTPGALFGP
jgi:hypothetical protein